MKIISGKSDSTRNLILQTLKIKNEATVEELAQAAGIAPVTVRHHLNTLQADQLLSIQAVRGKVGRPHYIYRLSERGQELFPKNYVRLSNRLFDELKKRFPPEVVSDIIRGVVTQIVADQGDSLADLPMEERLTLLVKLLSEEGFLADWELVGNQYFLTEHNCPYQSIGEKHHEICTFDTELLMSVLHTEVVQNRCKLNGDSCCQFAIGDALSIN